MSKQSNAKGNRIIHRFSGWALLFGALALTLLAACGGGGGGGGSGGGPGAVDLPSGNPSTVTLQTVIAPGADGCANGGYRVHYGIDDNKNGDLDLEEEDGFVVICNGVDGANPLVGLTPLNVGDANCPKGGVRIDWGVDADMSGQLESGESQGHQFVCNLGAGTGQGSSTTPEPISLDTPLVAVAPAGGSSYYSFVPDTLEVYIRLTRTDSDLSWTLYSDAGHTLVVQSCDTTLWDEDEACLSGLPALTPGQTYFLQVDEANYITNLFQLEVNSAFAGEGELLAPIPLGTAPLSHLGQVGSPNTTGASESFYEVLTPLPGGTRISLEGLTDAADLEVLYPDGTQACLSQNPDTQTESCLASSFYGSLLVKVNGAASLAGTGFSLIAGLDPGSLSSPIPLAFPSDFDWNQNYGYYHGGDSTSSTKYYEITGLTPGQAYKFDLAFSNYSAYYLNVFPSDGSYTTYECRTTSSCPALVATGTSIYVSVEYSYGGGAYTLYIDESYAEGEPLTPVDITGNLPYWGFADQGMSSYYRLDGLTPGNSYSVSIDSMAGTQSLRVYQDPFSNESTGYACEGKYPDPVACTLTVSGTSLWVRVESVGHWYYGTLLDAEYYINLLNNGSGSTFASEGTTGGGEIPLVVNDPPWAGSVDGTASYYTFTIGAEGAHRVALTSPSDNVDLSVYDNAGYTGTPLCSSINVGSADEECLVYLGPTGTQYWVKVDGSVALASLGASYNIAVNAYSEGSPSFPVELAGLLPFTGRVDANTYSYYAIGGLTAGNSYTVSFTAITGGNYWSTYQDQFIDEENGFACNTSGNNTCTFTASGTSLWLRTWTYSIPDATYSIALTDNGPGAVYLQEGTPGGGEILLTDDGTLWSGTVDATASYYTFTATTGGLSYLTLSGLEDNADLYVYDVPDYLGSQLCGGIQLYIYTENCYLATSAGQQYWLKVDGSRAQARLGSAYTLQIERLSEGTALAPYPISAATPYSTTFGGGYNYSYYEVTGLNPGHVYDLDLTMATGGSSLYLYRDQFTDLDNTLCTRTSITTAAPGLCTFVADAPSLWVRLYPTSSGTTLTLSLADGGPSTLAAEGSPGGGEIPLPVGDLPSPGHVDATASHYSFTAPAAGRYFLSLTAPVDDVGLHVYGEGTYTDPALCSSLQVGAVDEFCTVDATGGQTFWVKVDGSTALSTFGASYFLSLLALDEDPPGLAFSYSDPSLPVGIPDNDAVTGLPLPLTVSGAPAVLTEVAVKVNIAHQRANDLDLFLVSPAGTTIELSTVNGGYGRHYAGTIFHDRAPGSITAGSAPLTGYYRPEAPLAGLEGEDGNGIWTLHVYDHYFNYTGIVYGWSLYLR